MLNGLIKRFDTVRGQQRTVAQHAQVGFQDDLPCALVLNDEDDGSHHIGRHNI
ncbi:MAG: hypothetical protein M3072_02405 [Candidatus Dormibacteraeota bacterium]|nr:hypothetical protein [Candidatus Dormibacteraeota bacterium]